MSPGTRSLETPARLDNPASALSETPLELNVQYEQGVAVVTLEGPQVLRNHLDGELSPYQHFDFDESSLATLRAGQSKFHARALVFDESKKLLDSAVTEPFRLTH